MNASVSRWRADLMANRRSAKGRLVLSLFRFGQFLPARLREYYKPFYYVLVDVVMGISIPLETEIGPSFLLRHGQGVVISWKCIIDSGCEIHQGVTLGEKNGAAPRLGKNVTVGANAVLIGGVVVGDGSYIGAGAVVTKDVPANSVAMGVAASIR